jgi:hypothetical protein
MDFYIAFQEILPGKPGRVSLPGGKKVNDCGRHRPENPQDMLKIAQKTLNGARKIGMPRETVRRYLGERRSVRYGPCKPRP